MNMSLIAQCPNPAFTHPALQNWLLEWDITQPVPTSADSPTALSWLRRRAPSHIPTPILYKLFRQKTVRCFYPDSDGSVRKVSKNSPLPPGCQLLIPKNTLVLEGLEKRGNKEDDVGLRNDRIQPKSSSSAAASHTEPPPSPWRLKQKLHWLNQLRKSVIYKDQDILALNKPANLPVQGGSKVLYSIDYLKEEAFYHDVEHSEELRLVHRLDAQTSGCFLLARHVDAADWLSRAFRTPRVITKQYWAVVNTNMDNGHAIGPVKSTKKVIEVPGEMTEYTVLAVNTKSKLAILQMYPITGKKHQLRRHAAFHLNVTILGDDKYERAVILQAREGGGGGGGGELDGVSNQSHTTQLKMVKGIKSVPQPLYLHCHSLTIHNGGSGQDDVVRITAPPPPYWNRLFHRMGWEEMIPG